MPLGLPPIFSPTPTPSPTPAPAPPPEPTPVAAPVAAPAPAPAAPESQPKVEGGAHADRSRRSAMADRGQISLDLKVEDWLSQLKARLEVNMAPLADEEAPLLRKHSAIMAAAAYRATAEAQYGQGQRAASAEMER